MGYGLGLGLGPNMLGAGTRERRMAAPKIACLHAARFGAVLTERS